MWHQGSESAWKIIAPDGTKTSREKILGAKQRSEGRERNAAETNNNRAGALTKPAPGSVCFGASGRRRVGLALNFFERNSTIDGHFQPRFWFLASEEAS